MKNFLGKIYKYRRFTILLYFPIYMIWFLWLEKRDTEYAYMYCKLDDYIPFNEYFIIPYMLWFVFIIISLLLMGLNPTRLKIYKKEYPLYNYFRSQDEKDFDRCVISLMLGMTICLIIYTIFPNAQTLRPDELSYNNIFVKAVAKLYMGDTSTNVCPSIHTYNSIVVTYALWTSKSTNNGGVRVENVIKFISLLLCIMICLSTMFLKQHSAVDVFFAIVLWIIIYFIVYFPSRLSEWKSKKSNN